MRDKTLLVLAAGMGSRYGGLKQLDPMGPAGETLLDYSVYDAVKAGVTKIVFVIRKDFEEEFRKNVGSRYEDKLAVDYCFQDIKDLPEGFVPPADRVKPWGTAHAIAAARNVVTTPFLAINADDFYGAHAYASVCAELDAVDPSQPQFCMAGYRLANTLSEHGTVSRGVCETDAQSFLKTVVEHTKIEKTDTGARDVQADGTIHDFSGDELVSLNFWGFTPAIFPLLETLFIDFLKAEGENLKSEFYIPSAVADSITHHHATVKVIPTDSEWFGITYREDKPAVTERLAALTKAGVYPTPLW